MMSFKAFLSVLALALTLFAPTAIANAPFNDDVLYPDYPDNYVLRIEDRERAKKESGGVRAPATLQDQDICDVINGRLHCIKSVPDHNSSLKEFEERLDNTKYSTPGDFKQVPK